MLNDLVKKSRSKRTFESGRKISERTLLELCDLARFGPATMNLQPLKFRLVTEEDEVEATLGATRWAAAIKKKLPPEDHGPSAFIVICHDTSIVERKPIFMVDVGIVSQTIMLAACERGLGGCIIGSASESELSRILSLPEDTVPVLVLALGYPEETTVLTEAVGGDVKYYRDENDVHYVPKRTLDEIIIK